MTFEEFWLEVLTPGASVALDDTKLRRIYDHLVATGVDVRAVLEGRVSWVDKQLMNPEVRAAYERQRLEPLRELAERWGKPVETGGDRYNMGYEGATLACAAALRNAIAKLEGK